jgi:hypothetical protein
MPGGRVVRQHGVKVASGNEYREARASHPGKVVLAAPIRLRYDPNPEAQRLQETGDYGVPEGGVIYVSVADDT